MTNIEKAIENVKSLNLANIVREHDGYIIMAQSERDYNSKCGLINRGETFGFYTISTALKILPK